jgi:hypothetical protein
VRVSGQNTRLSSLNRRLASVVAASAILTAMAATTGQAYLGFPVYRPEGWLNPPIIFVMLAFVVISVLVATEASFRTLVQGKRFRDTAWPRPARLTGEEEPGTWRVSRQRHMLAAVLLGLLVLFEGLAHTGPRSGFWATSRPYHDNHPASADGYVAWFEGRPVLDESAYVMSQVDELSRHQPGKPVDLHINIARPGHATYAYLVTLFGRLTSALGSLYWAFIGVHVVAWWGAALAMYDLTGRARRSWWAGLLAGVLVATGLGFLFMVGNAMSGATAYAAIPLVLWVIQRLRVFDSQAPWSDLLIAAGLTTAAALTYGMVAFYLGAVVVFQLGRAELRRLVIWSAVVLGLGQVWSFLWQWARDTTSTSLPFGLLGADPVTVYGGLLVATILFALTRLPARVAELSLAATVSIAATGVSLAVVLRPSGMRELLNAMTSSLHVPRYLGDVGDIVAHLTGKSGTWVGFVETLRQSEFDANLLAAFPLPICLLALVGWLGLSRRWVEWALAIIAIAGLQTFVMNGVSGVPHPRLMYFAYPGIYLLAASGLFNMFQWTTRVVTLGNWLPPRMAQGIALLAVLIPLAYVIAMSNGALWNDWSVHRAFHHLD